jgi:segregation and condensation protein B
MATKTKHVFEQVSQVIQENDNDSQEVRSESAESEDKPVEEIVSDASQEGIEAEGFEAQASEPPEGPAEEELEHGAAGIQLELVENDPADEGSDGVDANLNRERIKLIIESLVFVAEKPVTPVQLSKAVRRRQPEVRALLQELAEEYKTRGIELVEIAGGFTFRSAASNAPYVREFLTSKPVRLSRAQLETLAIVAYRQPVTRPEIEDVRGVDTGSAIRVLLERGLIKMLGRKDEAGRPLLYGSTPYFLEFFGLKSLVDLPTLREFSDLSEESRDLFQRKTGESVDGTQMPQASSSATDDGDAAMEGDNEDNVDDDRGELSGENGDYLAQAETASVSNNSNNKDKIDLELLDNKENLDIDEDDETELELQDDEGKLSSEPSIIAPARGTDNDAHDEDQGDEEYESREDDEAYEDAQEDDDDEDDDDDDDDDDEDDDDEDEDDEDNDDDDEEGDGQPEDDKDDSPK